ncbi:integrase [Betaproteobacteria bacterium]|nr:integrase [Betaproteobacteria bacterium]
MEKRLALGKYPDTGLKEARERRDEARKLLANGADPGAVKKAQKAAQRDMAANTFEAVARKWFAKWKTEVSANTSKAQWERLEKHIFPYLGDCPISAVSAPAILAALRPLEERGTGDTLRKSKTVISLILRFAVQNGWAQGDPVPSLRGAFKAKEVKHMAALTRPVEVAELLRRIDSYKGQPEVCAALKLLPLVFVRPGELRGAKWSDIDLDRAEWKYTASKTNTEHLVPLARQAVEILQALYPISGGNRYGLVFPGMAAGKPISDGTINRALQYMGYDTQSEMTGHGFRALARTLLAEELGFDPLIIEHQLAHSVPDNLGTAYNRTKYLPQRKTMMQAWANFLYKLKAGAEVIPLRGQTA